ncbi:CGNR zinc finger domain-containing protein [Streptosporangium sp. NPDC023615]|uniref:CGNR zinc finger domain-containing protein n=1 Tax=Streptosporangium sp. NPDC023615 TaxID=3154794 RepID=UPI0034249351
MTYSGCEEVSDDMDNPSGLVIDFVNTYDVETGTESIPSPAALTAWLGRRGLIGDGDTADETDLARALDLREGLREALRRNHDRPPARERPAGQDRPLTPAPGPGTADTAAAAATAATGTAPDTPAVDATGDDEGGDLEDDGLHREDGRPARLLPAFAGLALQVTFGPLGPTLEPVATGVPGGLARIVAAVMDTHATGLWPRLKVCTESTCQWAFVDSSKNRSRSWCSMKVCGNRTKTRAYRARRQTEPGSRHL